MVRKTSRWNKVIAIGVGLLGSAGTEGVHELRGSSTRQEAREIVDAGLAVHEQRITVVEKVQLQTLDEIRDMKAAQAATNKKLDRMLEKLDHRDAGK